MKRMISVIVSLVLLTSLLSACNKPEENSSSIPPVTEETVVQTVSEGPVVPNVTGMTLDEAQNLTKEAGLVVQVTDSQWSADVEKDHVISQNPTEGQLPADGVFIYVVVSKGPQMAFVPNVIGMVKDQAVTALEALGFQVEFTEEYSSVAPGAVIRQGEAPETELREGSTIQLVVSKGLQNIETGKNVIIPALAGLSFDEAKAELLKYGLYIAVESRKNDVHAPEDSIMDQKPDAGTIAKSGETIMVVVSAGPEKVRMPDILYKTEEEATAFLKQSGIKYFSFAPEQSETVPRGRVCRQEFPAGSMLHKNQSIIVYISEGVSVMAPLLEGRTKEEALKLISEARLVAEVKEEYHPTYNKNHVYTQNPTPGTMVQLGEKITIYVSKGPEIVNVTMPDLYGKTSEEAVSLLEKAGLGYIFQSGFHESMPVGQIIAQSQPAGASVMAGETITVTVSIGKEGGNLITVPEVNGKSLAEAERLLKAAGFKVSSREISNLTVPQGHVVTRIPSDSKLPPNYEVELLVSSGPMKFTVLDFIGKTKENIVQNNVFQYEFIEDFHPTIAAGLACAQSEPAGKELNQNSKIVITISLGKPAAALSFKLTQMYMDIGQDLTPDKVIEPADAGNKVVQYTSSAPDVVSVTDTGVLRANKAGKAKVTMSCGGKTASCDVTVLPNESYNPRYFRITVKEDGTAVITGNTFLGQNPVDVRIPTAIDGYKVTAIGENAFLSVSAIGTVVIPEGITSIGEYAFSGCGKLTAVTISSDVKSIGRFAFSNTALTRVDIPAGVTSIGTGLASGSRQLTQINVAADNAHYKSVDGVLFDKAMTTLLAYPAAKAGSSYTVPSGVARIAYAAFVNNANLTTVTLPASLTAIETYAFREMARISSMYFEGNAPDYGEGIFMYSNISMRVYYRSGATGFGERYADRKTELYG